jgi:hypothetical protein
MSHFVIQANLGKSVIFHRETPVQSGVENLINEGLSKLLATTGGKPTEDAYVEVLHYYDDDPTPEVDMIIFADEIDDIFYEAETVSPNKSILPEIRGINPEEAYRRIALKSKGQTFASDTMEWDIDYLQTYETTYGTKLDGALYNPSTGETAEFEGATIKNTDVEIDPMYQNLEIAPYEAETEELKKTSCCCGATEAEPCLCMYQGVMSCSSVAPKCPCYAAKDSEAVLSKPSHMNYAESQTFEAPRSKKDFVWIGEDSSEKEWARTGRHTIDAAIKKAKAEGWKPVMSEYWGDNPATKKSRMRREAKVWNLMSKSPQWKPWLKFLTERNADNEMHETMEIFRGKAYWKDKNRNSVADSYVGTQNHGPWIYDEDRIYVPDHFSEDGGWQVLVKGNQALLLYYIADFDGPYSTPLMRKTFNLSPVKATKTAKKAKPKAKKTTTRKAKPKAKAKTGRKAPTISATKRKVGTRMRGNDGKMWQVKKSGKSQRWMAGAETQTQTFRSSIDSKFDELL